MKANRWSVFGTRPSSPMARANRERLLPRYRARMSSEALSIPSFSEPATRHRSSQGWAIRFVWMRWRAKPFRGP